MLNRLGLEADAAAAFKEAAAIDRRLAKAWRNLGRSLAASGDVAGAENALQESNRLNLEAQAARGPEKP